MLDQADEIRRLPPLARGEESRLRNSMVAHTDSSPRARGGKPGRPIQNWIGRLQSPRVRIETALGSTAQDRGEVATGREGKGLGVARDNAQIATAADLGIRRGVKPRRRISSG